MNISPLRNLVARHSKCACRPAPSTAITRLISGTTPRRTASTAPSNYSSYGTSESLKRRYNPAISSSSSSSRLTPYEVQRAKAIRRMKYSAFGVVLCAMAMGITILSADLPDARKQKEELEKRASTVTKLDGPPPPSTILADPNTIAEQNELVPTGTSTIPNFPRHITIHTPTPSGSAAAATENSQDSEYQLIGLGIRTVSIFGIQVYVVGLYVAVSDIARLQERLIRVIDDVATTLVPGEKGKLRQELLDPVRGEEIWDHILQHLGVRMALRIVPTRNTDFMHMRDGFVRGVTAKAAHFASDKGSKEFQDEGFGTSMNDFKTVFGGGARKKLPYGETLLLTRDAEGRLAASFEDKEGVRTSMGGLDDERVSRLLWLNYLAGKSVSSEDLRKHVVDGCIELVSRPVGTVAAQVV